MIDRAAPQDSLGTTLAALVRYRTLLRKLVIKDLKLKYRGSVFGFLWSLAQPAADDRGLHARVPLHPARRATEGLRVLR